MNLSILYFITRITVQAHFHSVVIYPGVGDFRASRPFKIDMQVPQFHLFAMCKGYHGHLAMKHQRCVISLNGQSLHLFKE